MPGEVAGTPANLRDHVRRPLRPPGADLHPPAGQGAYQRRRPGRGAGRNPYRPARCRRRAHRGPSFLRRHPPAGQHRGPVQEPDAGPAGDPGGARRAGQRARGRDAQAQLRQPPADRRADGGPPGLGQDDELGQVGQMVEAAGPEPHAGRGGPPASGRRRTAPGAGRPNRRDGLLGADRPRPLRAGRSRGGPAARPGHLHHRHGRAAHHRHRPHAADRGHRARRPSRTTRS